MMKRNYKKEIIPKDSRQLPCFTWISTGDCMYGNKCTYVHPPNIQNEDKTSIMMKPKKREKSDHVDDTFFWPKMENPSNDIKKKYELHAIDMKNKHDVCIFSIWKHYLLYCIFQDPQKLADSSINRKILFFLKQTTFDPHYIENQYTQSNRLSVFVQLSQSKSIEK
jgi:hypothetical protein